VNFQNFGILSSTRDSRASPFVDYLAEGRVMATACPQCGARYFPPQTECSKCLATHLDWCAMDPNVKLVTYTLARYGPAGFENRVPYALAIVESASGLQILGHLAGDISPEEIRPGLPLQIAPLKIDTNRWSYEFRKL
jgi:uncharacterized OB-fold protein